MTDAAKAWSCGAQRRFGSRLGRRCGDCRDGKDNRYLELGLAAGATAIVSSNEDLLVLNPWRDPGAEARSVSR
jgi:predicted nucleic acid-binding protein